MKIFGIGFHKTGTKSLAKALNLLGYKVTGPNLVHEVSTRELLFEQAKPIVDQYDAFQDNPWPLLYKELDQYYPKSLFILTIRPSEALLASIIRYFGSNSTPMRRLIYGYGSPIGHEMLYRDTFELHNQAVLRYFDGRKNDLLYGRHQRRRMGSVVPFLESSQTSASFSS